MKPAAIPFFHAGRRGGAASEALPIAFVSGPLIFDSGEADHTFFFRCQDRYVAYNALAGLRSLLFVGNVQHRCRYLQMLARLNANLERVSAWTGLRLPTVRTPLMVPLNPHTLSVEDAPFFQSDLQDSGVRQSLARGDIVFNQASPTGARLILELAALLRQHGTSWDLQPDRLQAQGALSLWCHDKANYVSVVAAAEHPTPPHAATAVISLGDVLALRGWDDLASLYQRCTNTRTPTALYVKSTSDSGGNVAARITAMNACRAIGALHHDISVRVLWESSGHGERLAELTRDVSIATTLQDSRPDEQALARYLESQRARRSTVRFLVQEAVESPGSPGPWQSEGIGVTCVVRAEGAADVYATAGQLYGDPQRHHYIGSILSETAADLQLDAAATADVRGLAAEFGKRGYEGPLNFDARRSASGEWVFIYDCNPRLSAIYPTLAVRSHISELHRVHTVMSFGYRGEFQTPDFDALLERLAAQRFLYLADTGRGALPLPNLAREDGCDFALVNMGPEEVDQFVRSPAIPPRAGVRLAVY